MYEVRPAADERDAETRRRIVTVADALSDRFTVVALALRGRLSTEIVDLGDDRLLELLGASIESNIETILHVLRYGIVIDRVEAPSAAIEYARRLAQNGVSVDALIRAYRLGQDSFLQVAFDELTDCEPELFATVVRTLTSTTFAYIDRISQTVLAAYEEEREDWLQNRNAKRAAQIKHLLGHNDVDIAAAETVLGYRLHFQRHLGVILWAGGDGRTPTSVAGFERCARNLAEGLGCSALPLFAPSDESFGWAWLPLEHKAPEPTSATIRQALARDGDINVAVGRSSVGADGFRRTHRQAAQAHAVALLTERPAGPVTSFADVGVVGLLCADITATRAWVQDTLGKLAVDDPARERMRETVRVFLNVGGSFTAAAAELTLHKNSVQYRVRKAEDELGRPLRVNRSEVELALRACHLLGGAVLQPTE